MALRRGPALVYRQPAANGRPPREPAGFREAESHDDYTGMGTTWSAALLEGAPVIAHVGDSRMYLVDGRLAC